MVIQPSLTSARRTGSLMVELLAGMALLVGTLLPLAYSFATEKRVARAYYQRVVAMEIVDGEMEILAAGEWRSFKPGTQDYVSRAAVVTNLPPGRFVLTISGQHLRLEWQPSIKQHGGSVVREVDVK
jgi:hypothetical protein